jgi:hypothetical protein
MGNAPFDGENKYVTTHQAHKLGFSASSEAVDAHITTLTVGYVLFQVFSTNYVLAKSAGVQEFALVPPEPLRTTLRSIWPTSSDLHWPGDSYVDFAGLQMARDWTIRVEGVSLRVTPSSLMRREFRGTFHLVR